MTTGETLFENESIDLSALPDVEEAELHRLSGNFFWVMFTRSNLFYLVLSIGLLIFIYQTDEVEGISVWLYIIAGVGVLWLLINVYLPFSFRKKGYALRDRDIIYKSGLWWTKVIIVPFNRIQHCEVQQGPVSKIFSMKSLTVFTAGGGSSDLKIGGLPDNKADQLKEFVLTKITQEDA